MGGTLAKIAERVIASGALAAAVADAEIAGPGFINVIVADCSPRRWLDMAMD